VKRPSPPAPPKKGKKEGGKAKADKPKPKPQPPQKIREKGETEAKKETEGKGGDKEEIPPNPLGKWSKSSKRRRAWRRRWKLTRQCQYIASSSST
jgi:hypothetical protein